MSSENIKVPISRILIRYDLATLKKIGEVFRTRKNKRDKHHDLVKKIITKIGKNEFTRDEFIQFMDDISLRHIYDNQLKNQSLRFFDESQKRIEIEKLKASIEEQQAKIKELEESYNQIEIKPENIRESEYEDAYFDHYGGSKDAASQDDPLRETLHDSSSSLQENFIDDIKTEKSVNRDYDDAWINYYGGVNKTKIIDKFKEKPFDNPITFYSLTDEEKKEFIEVLKDVYENKIKSMPINTKITVGFLIDNEWIYRPLDNFKIREAVEGLFEGDFTFTVEQIETVLSDAEAQIRLEFIDGIKFEICKKSQHDGDRSGHSSAFFPYRLKPEWKWFKYFTRKYQIGCSVYSFKHECPKKWLKHNCLSHSVLQSYPGETTLVRELDRKLDGAKYIDSYKLSELGETFDIQFVLRSRDNESKTIKKGNKANNGKYGPDNAKYTVNLSRYEEHYWVYETVPCSNFAIEHFQEIIKDKPIKCLDDFIKVCQVCKKKNGKYWSVDKNQARTNSLDLIINLQKAGAFTELYRNDLDVDLAEIHEWAPNEKSTELTIEKYNYKLMQNKETKE